MTKSEFLDFMKTDPIFKVADKQIVATLYESPFDNVILDEDTGSITFVYKGESITIAGDDADFGALMEELPSLEAILLAKKIIVNLGFDSNLIVIRPVDGGEIYRIEDFVTKYFAGDSEGGDGGDGGLA